jgi:hypothetical protein
MAELSKEALAVLELVPAWRRRTAAPDPATAALAQRIQQVCQELRFSAATIEEVLSTGPGLSACMAQPKAKRDLWARLCQARRATAQR